MTIDKPLVSIIMATYNRSHFIGEALKSIINQTYTHWECLIIDDGATDNTEEVVSAFIENDSRFSYIRRSAKYNKGLSGSRNQGLDLVRGKYIIIFDDDDIVHPRNLEINVKILNSGNFCFCRYDKLPFFANQKPVIKGDEEKIDVDTVGIDDIGRIVMGELPFASCTVMWRKDFIDEQRFNEDLSYAEEWEFYTRILSQGKEGVSINKVLYFNRKHKDSNTGEYWKGDSLRRNSKIKATKLIIENLAEKELLSNELSYFFIRLSFFLKEPSILKLVLKYSQLSTSQKLKYRIGSKFYRILKPVFRLKEKIKK